jgi:hypothetical protein
LFLVPCSSFLVPPFLVAKSMRASGASRHGFDQARRTRVRFGTCVFESTAAIVVRPTMPGLAADTVGGGHDRARCSSTPVGESDVDCWRMGSTAEPLLVRGHTLVHGGGGSDKVHCDSATYGADVVRLGAVTLTAGAKFTVDGRVAVGGLVCHSTHGVTCRVGAELDCPAPMVGPCLALHTPTVLPRTANARVVYANCVVESAAALRVRGTVAPADCRAASIRRCLFDVQDLAVSGWDVSADVAVDLGADACGALEYGTLRRDASVTLIAGDLNFIYGVHCEAGSRGIVCQPGATLRLSGLHDLPCTADEESEEEDEESEGEGQTQQQDGTYWRCRGGFLDDQDTDQDDDQEGDREDDQEPEPQRVAASMLDPRAPAFVPAASPCGSGIRALTVAHLEECLEQSQEDHVRACAVWATALTARLDKHLAHCMLRRRLRVEAEDGATAAAAVTAAALDKLEQEIRALDVSLERYREARSGAFDEVMLDEAILEAAMQ